MGLTTPTAAECTTESEATAGMVTAARMTRVRAAAKKAFTEPPSTRGKKRWIMIDSTQRAWKLAGAA